MWLCKRITNVFPKSEADPARHHVRRQRIYSIKADEVCDISNKGQVGLSFVLKDNKTRRSLKNSLSFSGVTRAARLELPKDNKTRRSLKNSSERCTIKHPTVLWLWSRRQ